MEHSSDSPGCPGPSRCVQFARRIGCCHPIEPSLHSSTRTLPPSPPALGNFRVGPGRPLVFEPTRTLRCVG